MWCLDKLNNLFASSGTMLRLGPLLFWAHLGFAAAASPPPHTCPNVSSHHRKVKLCNTGKWRREHHPSAKVTSALAANIVVEFNIDNSGQMLNLGGFKSAFWDILLPHGRLCPRLHFDLSALTSIAVTLLFFNWSGYMYVERWTLSVRPARNRPEYSVGAEPKQFIYREDWLDPLLQKADCLFEG